MAGWSEFLVATAGASAALAGLIIVAMSVNIDTIVGIPTMPSRAAATVALLVLVVVAALAGLVPGIADRAFGVLLLAGGLACGALAVRSGAQIVRARAETAILKASVTVVPCIPFVVGGGLLLAGLDDGVLWFAAGVLLVIVASVLNSWVLLVELRR